MAVDPYELLQAVEILSKMPKDFYEKIVRSCLSGSVVPPPQAGGRSRATSVSCGVCAGS